MSIIYLYGFVPPDTRLPEAGLLGIADTRVERVDGDAVAGVISRVDGAEFQGEALERNCADVEWMASLGLSHEQVVAWFVDHAAILPSRLLTLFSSEDALRRAMERDGGRIQATLERFDGLREWDLRVGYDAERLTAHLGEVSDEVGRLDRAIEEASPGKRFLLQKKREDMERVEGRAAARRLAGGLLDRLRPLARSVSILEPPADDAPASLNAALLVEEEREGTLQDRIEAERAELEPLGLVIRLTGPWAPYRFMEEADGE